jgi:hypothetical protein
MLKYLSIFAALVALGPNSVTAQEREAIFQKVAVSGASYDMILAVAKPGSPTVDYRDQPDPNIIYLGNGLVTAYTAELSKMLDLATLLQPALSFAPSSGDKKDRAPILVYFVSKKTASTTAAMR